MMKRLHAGLPFAIVFAFGALVLWTGCDSGSNEPDLSDLITRDIKVGTGAEAVEGSRIFFHAVGKAEDGAVFDSSYSRGVPFVFRMNKEQLLGGLFYGIQGMKVGGIRSITIPPELAFGKEGRGDLVGPNETVVFEVELLRVDTPGTLYTETLVEGEADADSTAEGDQVTAHFVGWLGLGAKFQSSRDDGQPYTYIQGDPSLISGWNLGTLGMQVGELRRIVVPPDMAFGFTGVPGLIPSNAIIIFDVEVLEIAE